MQCTNHRAEDLYLSIMHDGEGYKERLDHGRGATHELFWLLLVRHRAVEHTWKFQPDEPFTDSDILEAAWRLSVYYHDHVKEIDH